MSINAALGFKCNLPKSEQLMESMVDYCVREWLRENDPEWAANNTVEAVEDKEAENGKDQA